MKNLNNIEDWLDVQEHQMIGEILIQSDKITLQDLGMALDIQKFEKIYLGYILLNMKVITQEDLKASLDLQMKIDKYLKHRSNNDV
jgi:hypothetical protein